MATKTSVVPQVVPTTQGDTKSSDSVSIIVPCCGQLEYTRLCVPRLLKHGGQPHELIFVDFGSLDGTAEYLAGVAAAAPLRVEVIHSPADPSWPGAYKEAFARAGGEFLVLVTNDTIVTGDWLKHLVGLAKLVATIGMVGPMSNYAPAVQCVGPLPYRIRRRQDGSVDTSTDDSELDLQPIDHFARDWRQQHRGQWFEVEFLGSFCLLIKREVLKTTDLFEAALPVNGLSELDAVSVRARRAGYVLACCRDLFVHHFGSRQFQPESIGARDKP